MALEDVLWEAWRPPSAKRGVGEGKAGGRSKAPFTRGQARAKLSRILNRAPEVMVKVTGRQRDGNHLLAHLDYIGRKGDLRIETRDGEVLQDRAELTERAEEWANDVYRDGRARVAGVAMVFSMPEGTDPETVREAVRSVAETELADRHDYVMALHTDTPRPHVHLTVAARGMEGTRFNPRPDDLFRFRDRFAEELRERGVEAEATPRRARGMMRAGQSMALHKMRGRFLTGTGVETAADRRIRADAKRFSDGKLGPLPFETAAANRWKSITDNYHAAAAELRGSSNDEERALGAKLSQFIDRAPVPLSARAKAGVERRMAIEKRPERSPDRER